jgi:hypothetical protein
MSAMNRMCASYLRNGEAGNVETKQAAVKLQIDSGKLSSVEVT